MVVILQGSRQPRRESKSFKPAGGVRMNGRADMAPRDVPAPNEMAKNGSSWSSPARGTCLGEARRPDSTTGEWIRGRAKHAGDSAVIGDGCFALGFHEG